MNGYVETGYVVILGSLGTYALALVSRERAARRRIGAASGKPPTTGYEAPVTTDAPSHPTNASAVSRGAEEEGPL